MSADKQNYRDLWLKLFRYFLTNSKYLTEKDLLELKAQISESDWKSDFEVVISPLREELRALGREKGRKERLVTGRTEILLRILTKFLGDVPPSVCDKLREIQYLNKLDQLTDVALDCKTLDEFEAALNK